MQKQIQQTISSIEVAKMVEKEHKELLRDIRRYCEQLGESKIALTDFFIESSYRTAQNKEMPCFDVTKKGCEFIAHKLTGIKGTEFTAKYINRFHDMEDTIKYGIPQKTISHNIQIPSSVNTAAKIIKDIYMEAGADSKYIAIAITNLYKESTGYNPGITLKTDGMHLQIEEGKKYEQFNSNR